MTRRTGPMRLVRRPLSGGGLLMTPVSLAGRPAGLLTAFVLIASLGSATAGAQTTHPLDGNVRFQIGNDQPIPITWAARRPHGAVHAIPGATVAMTSPNGAVTLKPGQLTHARTPNWLFGLALDPNFAVFQLGTSLAVSFPAAVEGTVSFAPAGRAGADVVTFCPGDVVTPAGNPMCSDPSEGIISGLMRYTRTGAEIGGPARGSFSGTANVAFRLSGGPLCAYASGANPSCKAIFALTTPPPTGAWGGSFGVFVSTLRDAPSPGRFYVTLGPVGTILGITPTPYLGLGLPNLLTSYGGPWTAGKLTLSVTDNTGASTEVFVLSGMDTRDPITGQGSVSLVSGSVSDRSLWAPTANRGWLNLIIKPPFGVVPAMTTPGLGAVIGLIALVGAYFVRKRLS
jgi:hypothetical protein